MSDNALNDRRATIVDCAVLGQVMIAYQLYVEAHPDHAEETEAHNMIALGNQAIEKIQARASDFSGAIMDAKALIARIGGHHE